jgi:cytochrome c oxidase subunit III
MNLFRKTFHYLDQGQHKRTNMVTVCILLMGTLLILFIPLIIKLIQAQLIEDGTPFAVPHAFGLSTLVLVASIWVLYRARAFKARDQHRLLRRSLFILLTLGGLFLLLQYKGWQQVFADPHHQQIKILMVIVAVHALHFAIALILTAIQLIRTMSIKSPAESYIYFLNPERNQFFKSTYLYWDYLGYLWTGLYVILLIKGL